LLNGKASLSPQMAVRISKATNTTPESWLAMQSKLDLWHAQQRSLKVKEFQRIAKT